MDEVKQPSAWALERAGKIKMPDRFSVLSFTGVHRNIALALDAALEEGRREGRNHSVSIRLMDELLKDYTDVIVERDKEIATLKQQLAEATSMSDRYQEALENIFYITTETQMEFKASFEDAVQSLEGEIKLLKEAKRLPEVGFNDLSPDDYYWAVSKLNKFPVCAQDAEENLTLTGYRFFGPIPMPEGKVGE